MAVISSLTCYRIRYSVYFGTLLGFYRNGAFIPHDDDIDVVLIDPDKDLLKIFLRKLKEHAFSVNRHEGDILTIQRDGVNIDFYIAKKNINRYTCNNYVFPCEYLDNIKDFEIFGVNVKIPHNTEKCLKHLYGESWNVPISGYSASPKRIEYRMKLAIKRVLPNVIWRFLKVLLRKA